MYNFSKHNGPRPTGYNMRAQSGASLVRQPEDSAFPPGDDDDEDTRSFGEQQQHPAAQLKELARWRKQLDHNESHFVSLRSTAHGRATPKEVQNAVAKQHKYTYKRERETQGTHNQARDSLHFDAVYSDAHADADTWSQLEMSSFVPRDCSDHWASKTRQHRENGVALLAQRDVARARSAALGPQDDIAGKPQLECAAHAVEGHHRPLSMESPPARGAASWTPSMRSGRGDVSMVGRWGPRSADAHTRAVASRSWDHSSWTYVSRADAAHVSGATTSTRHGPVADWGDPEASSNAARQRMRKPPCPLPARAADDHRN